MIKDQNIDKTTKSVLAIISLHKHATATTGTNLMMVGVPFDCKVLNATITTMSSTSATGTVDIIALTAATGTAGVSIFSSANTVAGTAGAYLDASPICPIRQVLKFLWALYWLCRQVMLFWGTLLLICTLDHLLAKKLQLAEAIKEITNG